MSVGTNGNHGLCFAWSSSNTGCPPKQRQINLFKKGNYLYSSINGKSSVVSSNNMPEKGISKSLPHKNILVGAQFRLPQSGSQLMNAYDTRSSAASKASLCTLKILAGHGPKGKHVQAGAVSIRVFTSSPTTQTMLLPIGDNVTPRKWSADLLKWQAVLITKAFSLKHVLTTLNIP